MAKIPNLQMRLPAAPLYDSLLWDCFLPKREHDLTCNSYDCMKLLDIAHLSQYRLLYRVSAVSPSPHFKHERTFSWRCQILNCEFFLFRFIQKQVKAPQIILALLKLGMDEGLDLLCQSSTAVL